MTHFLEREWMLDDNRAVIRKKLTPPRSITDRPQKIYRKQKGENRSGAIGSD
jgi:hypothetical protein